jgi:hypothetical protein
VPLCDLTASFLEIIPSGMRDPLCGHSCICILDRSDETKEASMQKRIARALVVGAATAGLVGAGAGVANAADPTCLEESLSGAAADPAGAFGAVVADPAGALEADLACAQEVVGG